MKKTASLQQRSKRRKAIYFGLSKLLSETQVEKALSIWEGSFSSSDEFKMQAYLTEVMAIDGVTLGRSELQRSIFAALQLDEKNLPTDPFQSQVNNKDVAPPEVYIVLDALWKELAKEIENRHEDDSLIKLTNSLNASISGQTWTALQGRHIRAWIESGNGVEQVELSVQQIKELFHWIYVNTCKTIGPVLTDSYISHAAEVIAEQVPEATIVPPRSLF